MSGKANHARQRLAFLNFTHKNAAWLPNSKSTNLPTAQALFWTGTHTLGWSILAQVDGKTYTLFGAPKGITNTTAATQKSLTYTSTHTTATLDAGSAAIILDFFSPVSPKNLLRQSLPFSYLTVTVAGLNGATPSVQLFTAIDDSWTGGQGNIVPEYQTMGTTSMFGLYSPKQILYAESNNLAQWGTVTLATTQGSSSTLTHESGTTDSLYSTFIETGKLNNQVPTYVAGDSIALSHDLKTVSTSTSINFAVGQYRISVARYLGQEQVGYHNSKYAGVLEAIDGFLSDYAAASTESQTLDKQLEQASAAVSSNYSDLTSAALRQV